MRGQSPRVTRIIPHIVTAKGYRILVAIKKGLPYIWIRPFTDKDWNKLPHISITSPNEWDPTSLDSSISEEWYHNQDYDPCLLQQGILSEIGDLKPDLEGNEDNEDQIYEHVSQDGIKVFLAKMIESKLSDRFIICEINREQTPIEYTPSVHNEYFTPTQRDCYPVTTRSKS